MREARACRVVGLSRTVHHYLTKPSKQTPPQSRIREIAYARVRYGYFRIYIMLRREGWHVNHKRIHRLYRLEGLNLRHHKPRRHKTSSLRVNCLPAQRINQCWSRDFVADHLFNGNRLRFLTVVDIYTRK